MEYNIIINGEIVGNGLSEGEAKSWLASYMNGRDGVVMKDKLCNIANCDGSASHDDVLDHLHLEELVPFTITILEFRGAPMELTIEEYDW